ncbi:DUF4041 domain-containing protein [Agrococcus jenensis]|uniref:T5orf172 domain-containing protein n=1 Tax=Agrococcus jenensis TaxID=46353 RepID=A0A3N2AR71_9MICO|nr:DUF4041 domain-containing protein [Agrococcus jenensis]ROR65549.1 T5orf172 domain-containing protein [Agrococcus jenensis]
MRFNPPPNWPQPPAGWQPPPTWTPEPSWGAAPEGWQLWVDDDLASGTARPAAVPEAQLRDETLAGAVQQAPPSDSADDELSVIDLDDERVLQSVGIYRYHHPLESAPAFAAALEDLQKEVAASVKDDSAILRSNLFTLNNSLAEGRRMSADLAKLMLSAYNAEADNCVRTLRAGNVEIAKRRLEACRRRISKYGARMEMRVSDQYHELRVRELELTADWLMKKQEEREEAREQRAALKEQKRVERELAEQRELLEKERAHFLNALAAVGVDSDEGVELRARLSEIDAAIEQNDFRAANIRAGYVYVISNRGAFGRQVVKIGLTRRLDPLERISELSGASVPFRFDVHALYFSDDAVGLEAELHRHFRSRALNVANNRKEFFFATPQEVRTVLMAQVGNLLEFDEEAAATEYLQSVGSWPEGALSGPISH